MSRNIEEPRTPADALEVAGGLAALEAAAWSAAVPYLPTLLLDAARRHPDRPAIWIDSLEGTLVLADISGFTRMSERLAEVGKEGAEWLTNIINQYFRRMLDITQEYGGSNVKFGGDALLLLFTSENHAGRAIATASAMLRASRQFTTVRVGRERIRLSMSVGVHSGAFWSASAGVPGRRMQHFILGREASRVAETEAAAVAGELLITGATLRLAGGLRVGEPRGDAYRVLRVSSRTASSSLAGDEPDPLPSPTSELLAHLPPPVVQALLSDDKAGGVEGEHRKVSILFINLFGVTELLEEQGPGVCLDELQRYVSSVVRMAERYGGFLAGNDIYTEGLKLILIFGAPVAHEQDSANALRLALELDNELPQLDVRLRHRIGINSGFVFAGDVGSPYRRE
ncbi:MAG: adenylate/guanylate cyclase domain-containing protein, partial [Dehalococcoidia bacterium]